MLATEFTVHSMDARNHGASAHLPDISYPAMAADVQATCQHLKIESTHLLGHSMGGKTAMQIALTSPELIERLIIVDIGPRQYPHHHQQILHGLGVLQQTSLSSRRQADELLAQHVDEKMVRAFLLKSLQRSESGQYKLTINVDAINEHYADIAAAVIPADSHQGYQGSTLFIKGLESDYLQADDRALVLKLFPHAQLKTIDGAGHWPHSEKPDVVYKVITDFLNQPMDA